MHHTLHKEWDNGGTSGQRQKINLYLLHGGQVDIAVATLDYNGAGYQASYRYEREGYDSWPSTVDQDEWFGIVNDLITDLVIAGCSSHYEGYLKSEEGEWMLNFTADDFAPSEWSTVW